MNFHQQIHSLDLESLKQLEKSLSEQVNSENHAENQIIQKHQKQALESAQFLQIYHECTTKALQQLEQLKQTKHHQEIEPDLPSDRSSSNEADVLSRNGLRLLWDAFDETEYLRATCIYFHLQKLNIVSQDSLAFFKSRLIQSSYIALSRGQSDGDLIRAVLNFDSSDFLPLLQRSMENNLPTAIEEFKKCFTTLENCEASSLVEAAQTFQLDEHPEISITVPLMDFNERRDNHLLFISEVANSACILLQRHLDSGLDIDPTLLTKLDDLKVSTDKLNHLRQTHQEIVSARASGHLKNEILIFLDRLMKALQTTIRAKTPEGYGAHSKQTLLPNLLAILKMLADSGLKESEVTELWQSLNHQTLKNKINIILTLHRNELASLNTQLRIPLPPRTYLPIQLFHELESHSLNALNSNKIISLFLKLLKKAIFDEFEQDWLASIDGSINQLTQKYSQLFALSWLSDAFLSLQVIEEDRISYMNKLDLNAKIKLYRSSQLLLMGLLSSTEISPDLQSPPQHKPIARAPSIVPHFKVNSK